MNKGRTMAQFEFTEDKVEEKKSVKGAPKQAATANTQQAQVAKNVATELDRVVKSASPKKPILIQMDHNQFRAMNGLMPKAR